MKLLIVAQRYYPDNIRINEITYELVKRGHQVTVLTGLPDYMTGTVPKEFKWFRKRKETINGVQVIRVPIIARRTGVIFRALNYVSFLLTSTICASFLSKDYDVIFCYSLSPITTAHAALRMKKWTGKRLLLYCLDIWPECLKAWNVKETSLLFKVTLKYSRWIYQNCDNVAISSQPFREYLMDVDGVAEDRILYLPQHADEAVINMTDTPKKATGEPVHFAFAGNIGKVQDVECIVRAVSHLKDETNFTVHVYGNGSSLEDCLALAKDLGAEDHIRFYGRVDKAELQQEYRKMDALLLTMKSEGFIGKTMPAKLQEYMSLGKPVIAAIGGAAEQVIREAKCGLVVPSSDDVALAECMRAFIHQPEFYEPMGIRAYEYYRKNFTLEVFMDKFENLLSNMR